MRRVVIGTAVVVVGASALFFSGTPSAIGTPEEIKTAEEQYFADNGKYLQVLPNNQLPTYETGTVKDKLAKDISPDIAITVYETPTGEKGYQVIQTQGGTTTSTGYGPEAKIRTYTIEPDPIPAASSTK